MENVTKEKGLVVIKESFFTKIRNFLLQKFGKKNVEVQIVEEKVDNIVEKVEQSENNEEINENESLLKSEENEKVEEVYEAKEEIERKLMNFYESIRKCI